MTPDQKMTKDGDEGSDEGDIRLGLAKWRPGKTLGRHLDNHDQEQDDEQDDDEANADLSLHILEKADQRQKTSSAGWGSTYDPFAVGTVPIAYKNECYGGGRTSLVIEDVDGKEPTTSRSETPEEGELQEDGDGNLVLAAELHRGPGRTTESRKKRKRKGKRKKWKGGIAGGDTYLLRKMEAGNRGEESMVMRKLLRGPRYFDPPEEQGQSCYNCGKIGHWAGDCPDGPRLKPCYICGGFGHDGRECPQKIDCFVCGKVGHMAKNCPNKGLIKGKERDSLCLVCGRSGHEASTCYHVYDSKDLEKIQCYICKKFGHLCCVIVVDSFPLPSSCFNCGEMGHTGVGCGRPRGKEKERGHPSVCFKCGEAGHYARNCSKDRNAAWPPPWPSEGQGLSGSHLLSSRHQSATDDQDSRWMDPPPSKDIRNASRRISTQDRWTGSRVRVRGFPLLMSE